MPKLVVYRNILFFLLGLFLLNLCIGFYGSMKNANSNKSTSINYVVQDKEIVKNSSKYGTVDYISQAREMIDIFHALARRDDLHVVIISGRSNVNQD